MSQVRDAISDEAIKGEQVITVKQIMEALDAEDKPIRMRCSSKGSVPDHFHVTEIGKVDKAFVDCGGTVRVTNHCSVQLWVANDLNHRITPKKLHGMFAKANELVPIEDLPVQIEYGNQGIGVYDLKEISSDKALNFVLEGKEAACLAPEICGLEVLGCNTEGCC